MKYGILILAATCCTGQNISTLTAQIQRTPTAALYVERASAYLAAGDARQAVADSDRALDRDALSVRALTLRAQGNMKLGRNSDAVTDLTGAIALAPTDATLYMTRAAAYAAIGDQPRALADRNEALRLDPSAVPVAAPEPVAVAAVATPPAPAPPVKPVPPPAKPAPAAKPTATAPVVAVETADSHYQRGKALLNQGKYVDAVAALNEAIKLEPTNPILFNTRGYASYLAKDVKKALADYDQAIKLNPDYLNATHNRAVARRAAGDAAGADADKKREAELTQKQAGK